MVRDKSSGAHQDFFQQHSGLSAEELVSHITSSSMLHPISTRAVVALCLPAELQAHSCKCPPL